MSNSVVKLLQNILITDHKCEGVIPLECSVFPTKVIKIVQPGSIPVTIVTPGAGCATIATCPAVHTALHCPTPTLSLSQFSGVFEMLRYYSEHSYHTGSHYSHTWYTSWWLVSCQSPSHYINHVHTSHHRHLLTARVIRTDHQDDTSLLRAPNKVARGGSQR